MSGYAVKLTDEQKEKVVPQLHAFYTDAIDLTKKENPEFILISFDDWQVLYKDGIQVKANHSLEVTDAFDILNIKYKSYYYTEFFTNDADINNFESYLEINGNISKNINDFYDIIKCYNGSIPLK